MNNPSNYLTPYEVADLRGVHHSTVRLWCKRGLMPFLRVSKHCLLISEKDARTFVIPERGNPNWKKKSKK